MKVYCLHSFFLPKGVLNRPGGNIDFVSGELRVDRSTNQPTFGPKSKYAGELDMNARATIIVTPSIPDFTHYDSTYRDNAIFTFTFHKKCS